MSRHTATDALLILAQIFDASFPSGSFAHSFGMEAHAPRIGDAAALEAHLGRVIAHQYAKLEFPLARKLYGFLARSRLQNIKRLDAQYSAMLSYPASCASLCIGENYLSHVRRLTLRTDVAKRFVALESPCNEIILLGVLAYDLGLGVEEFLALWAKKNLINQATSMLKISRIKPSEVQRVLFALDEPLFNAITCAHTKMTNLNPLFDEVIYTHKFIEPRLFIT